MDEKYYVQSTLAEIFKVAEGQVKFQRSIDFDYVTFYGDDKKARNFQIPKKIFVQITDYGEWIKNYFTEKYPELLL